MLRSGQVTGALAAPLREGDCGENSPLRLEKAAGVTFSGAPLETCGMAEGLARFAAIAEEAARDILGTELHTIVTGPGYECRRRNRAATGKLSEHAFANALDVTAFRLADGRRITVEADWPRLQPAAEPDNGEASSDHAASNEKSADPPKPLPASQRATTPEAKFLARVHDAACTIFTTVLSPDSNAAHHSHFHFDLGCHGRNCTYLICE